MNLVLRIDKGSDIEIAQIVGDAEGGRDINVFVAPRSEITEGIVVDDEGHLSSRLILLNPDEIKAQKFITGIKGIGIDGDGPVRAVPWSSMVMGPDVKVYCWLRLLNPRPGVLFPKSPVGLKANAWFTPSGLMLPKLME